MLRSLVHLLGEDAPAFRRYAWMAISYGLLSGLTITALVPVLHALLAGDTAGAAWWLTVLLVGFVACWAWRRRVEMAGIGVGIAVLQGARHRIGDHVARLPVGWFTPENTARLNHIVTHGMMEIAQLPAHVFTPALSGAVTPLVIVTALLALHWQMGLIALAALPVIVGMFFVSARLGRRADEAFHHSSAATSGRLIEFAQAQSVLRAFNGDGSGTRFLEDAIDRQRRSARQLIHLSTASVLLNAWMVQAVFAALLITGASWLSTRLGDTVETGTIISVIISLLLAVRFVDPLLDAAGYGDALRAARVQLDAVRDILAIEPMPETDRPQSPRDASVEFRGVTFRYEPGAPDVLRDVSLRIEPGSMTALVGPSGSGKTTLARLIARFLDVSEGSVEVGGIDVREMPVAQLAGQLIQIFQDNYLFRGSIADNIRVGKPEASEAEVLAAARLSGAVEIIERLPEGLDTPVGEGGARLSGGERQRISIARALIRDAPILLVDEATAALDAENQAAIADTLARLRGKRTLIVIAHQLSTVMMADQIVVLHEGIVSERGTHDQLVAADGIYARFIAQRQAARGWRIGPAARPAPMPPAAA